MRARGQLWSLDVVLAAAVFTLAIGIVISQSELHLFYGTQDRIQGTLFQQALLGSNGLMSKSDLFIGNVPQGSCPPFPAPCAFPPEDVQDNLRCGPNIRSDLFPAPIIEIAGWAADNELSILENCLIDKDTAYRRGFFGLTAPYSVEISADVYDEAIGTTRGLLLYTLAPASPDIPFFTISRRMIVFPNHVDAVKFRSCLDGDCAAHITDARVKVWRD